MAAKPDPQRRQNLPIPDPQWVGVTTYDAKDPDTNSHRSNRCVPRKALQTY